MKPPLFTMSDPFSEGAAEGVQPEFAREYPLRILISDDNYINRRVLSLLLQRLGYQPVTTENGEECLNAALNETYDLLLIDVDMPVMSGIECTQLIRHAGLDLPIVAVTATMPEVSRDKSFAAGMTGYMNKPVRLKELKKTLIEASQARRRKATAAATSEA